MHGLHALVRNVIDPFAYFFLEVLYECSDQRRDVLDALTEGQSQNGKDTQAIAQVAAEPSRGDFLR